MTTAATDHEKEKRLVARAKPEIHQRIAEAAELQGSTVSQFLLDAALERAAQLVEAGADILDIGGESTRPGSDSVSSTQELDRVLPVIEKLVSEYSLPISIDTQKAEVAAQAIRSGASIVNHVSASLDFETMLSVLKTSKAGYVAMHMKDRPKVMQKRAEYENVVREVIHDLSCLLGKLEHEGIRRERLLFDPGIGFGKKLEHNLELMANTPMLAEALGRPMVMGISRKSWMTHFFGVAPEAIADRDVYTMITSVLMPFPPVAVHRVHNAAMMRQAIKLRCALEERSELGRRAI